VPGYEGFAGTPGVQELTFGSPKSPLHIALDTKLPDSPSIESLGSSQHNHTALTSPQDSNWDQPLQEGILAVKLPDSPTSEDALPSPQGSSPASYDHIRCDSKLALRLSVDKFYLHS
jgi:hypothetical protein